MGKLLHVPQMFYFSVVVDKLGTELVRLPRVQRPTANCPNNFINVVAGTS
jgi:hypothetical protein